VTELICVVCPKGCHLKVDENNNYAVTGNGCLKGVEYGKNELIRPMRVLTSTVKIAGGIHKRLPVKTSREIPKSKMMECMKALNGVMVTSPVKMEDVILHDVLGLDVDIVATRDM